MTYRQAPRPSFEMQDEDLMMHKQESDRVWYYARFSGMLKDWPKMLEVEREPYAFAGQQPMDADDAGNFAGHALYIRSPMSGH